DEVTREDFIQVLNHPDLKSLLHIVALVNTPVKAARATLVPNIQLPKNSSTDPQVPMSTKSKPSLVRETPPPKIPLTLPDFDLAVSERGTLSARASRVLRVSDRAILAENASGREIWVPKMALCGDSAPPPTPQATPWTFSVKGWFVKKRDFQEWLLDGT
ncbi:MAG: hypothetical protein RBG13Loki_2171, partial [Promethearchaeota archaeon CR_4]